MLGNETLANLFGDTDLRSSGRIGNSVERTQSFAYCDISDADTAKVLLQITVADSVNEADASRRRGMVAREFRELQGCSRQERLDGVGYLCVTPTDLTASTVTKARLIRVRVPGELGTQMSTAEVTALFREVDRRVAATP